MGILGAAGQLFNTVRKAPTAGKFLQKAFKGGASKVDDVLRGTPLGNNPVVRAGKPPATSLDSVRFGRTGDVLPGYSAAHATRAAGGDPFYGSRTPFVFGSPQTPVAFPPNPNVGTQLIQRSAASKGRIPKGFAQGVKPGAPGTSVGRAVYPGQPNPITGPAPTKLAGTGGVGKSLMNFVAPGQNPLGRAWGFSGRALNAVGLYEGARKLTQGDVGGAAASLASSFPGRTLGLASRALGGIAKPLIGATALLALTPGSGGNSSLNDYYQTLTPEQKKKFEAETRSQQENMSAAEKRTMGITPAESVFENLPPELLPGGPTPELPGAPTINNPPNNLPSSPEAVVANPLQQKMAEYEQGRAKATTQEEMNAVRDLGMSIHQAAYPQMYEESYNPLMAATFPERYQKTPEDFIVQGGIQAPRSMTEKDAAQATAFANKVQNIQGLDANPMYYPFEAAEEQSMLDVKPMYNPFEALAAVTASKRYSP
jgi:hypothetical protein